MQPPRKPWLRREEVHMGQGGRGSRESGHPRPLGEFTVPQERDVLRARHHWDPVKKVFKTNAVTTKFMRLLVILVSDQFDCTLVIFVNGHCAFGRESSTGLRPKATRRLRHWRAQVGHSIQPGIEHIERTPGGVSTVVWTRAWCRRRRHVEEVLP